MPPNGTYFYIWQIPAVGTAEKLIMTLAPWKEKIKGFYLKVNEHVRCSNQLNAQLQPVANDTYLLQWIQTMRNAGYEVEGWGYVYPDNTATSGNEATSQGIRIAERVATLGLKSYLVDAEKEWKVGTNLSSSARALLDKVPEGIDTGLTTYRYPDYHPEFPYSSFLTHPHIKFNSPQVYWIGAHNPVAQTIQSYNQYHELAGGNEPFLPSASAFGDRVPNGDYWMPTIADITEMQTHCLRHYGGVIWWSLDWIIRREKWEWLDAICKVPTQPPAPVDPNEIIPLKQVIVTTATLNIRSLPNSLSNDIGTLHAGCDIGVLAEQDGWYNIGCGWIKASYTRNK